MATGIPSLLSGVAQAANAITLLASDAAGVLGMFQAPQWGIFDQFGNPVLVANSVAAVDYRREYRISDYPVEQGGFASYDKVQMPFDARVTFVVTGSLSLISSILSGGAIGSLITGTDSAQANRAAFLAAMETAAASLNLYSLITPEITYQSANIVHCDYRREARNGTTMIRVDVWLVEVRVAPAAQMSNTQAPSGASPVNGGTVQTVTPSPAQAARAAAN